MGNFDVHLGHAQILSNVVNSARASGLKSCILSFHPHPLRVVAPERAPGMLQTIEEKLISLSAYEPDFVLVVPFSWEFSQTPAPDFVDKYLLGLLDCRELHVGADARFGRKREGDVSSQAFIRQDVPAERCERAGWRAQGFVLQNQAIHSWRHG